MEGGEGKEKEGMKEGDAGVGKEGDKMDGVVVLYCTDSALSWFWS